MMIVSLFLSHTHRHTQFLMVVGNGLRGGMEIEETMSIFLSLSLSPTILIHIQYL